jgi:branched-chain amino acid transport system ATP-binding protein/urea transport system ATP-binding protein
LEDIGKRLLELADVRAGYGVTTVLRGFNLAVGDREIITVLGRNGAGKTTLLRAIMGIVQLRSGSIRLEGQDISRLRTHERAQRGIAYVPQGRLVFPGLSVLDNLRVASYGTLQRDRSEALGQMFADFPVLGEKRRARAGTLSGGQQQMLALARALMTNPRVLLLDEPSEGIQPSIVDQIADTVRTMHQKRAISVVLVEQNLDFVARLATRAYVVDKGQIVGEFPANEILKNKELQREYMGV